MADDTPQETPERGAPEPPQPTPGESPEETVAALRKALERANKEAETARTQLKTLKPLADRAKELEDASKSELERLAEQLNAEKAQGGEAKTMLQKLQVAMDKAPPGTDAATLRWIAGRLQGATQEELEADAEEAFARFQPATPPPAVNGQRVPVENLRPGALPTTPQPSLIDQITAAEQAKDWKLAMALKSQHVQQLRADQPQ